MHRHYAHLLKNPLSALLIAALLAVTGIPTALAAAEPSAYEKNKPPSTNSTQAAKAQAAPDFTQKKSPAQVSGREIVVTATRTEHEVFDVPSSAAIVSHKQMEREPRATIAEQLQDIPGVEVSDGGMGGGSKRVSIRGESSARVLILIDGMKISEQKSMDGSMIMIDPLNVERVEVIKGPASVLYGSEAMGGVVNIITKKGGERPVQGALAFTYDSSNQSVTPYASMYGSYKGFSYRVSGDYTDAGDKEGGSGTIENSDYLQRNLSAYLDYAFEKGKIGVGYDQFWTNVSVPGVAEDGAIVNMGLPKWQRDRYYGFIELNKLSDSLQKIKLTSSFQETKKDFWNDIRVSQHGIPIGGGNSMDMDMWQYPYTHNTQKTYGTNMQTDWTFGKDHYVIAGIDYLYDDLDATDDRTGTTTTQMYGPGGLPIGPSITTTTNDLFTYEAHQQTVAFFAQDEWTFLPDWTATFGLRQTWVQSALDSTDDPSVDEDSSSDSHVVGSLGLVYSGFHDWRLRTLYSQGYRYPLLNQLYIGTTHGSDGGKMYPNPDLKPETSQNFEVGARYDAFGIGADLTVYYNLADDYISARTLPGGTGDTIFENVDTAESYGSELTLSYTFDSWGLTPYISGAYIHQSFDRGDQGGKTTDTGTPNWAGRAGVKYEKLLTPVLSFHADAFARGAVSADEELSDGTMEKHAGWGTANLATGVRMGEKQNYFVDLNLNNLLNKRYTTAANTLEEPGFNAVLRMGVEF